MMYLVSEKDENGNDSNFDSSEISMIWGLVREQNASLLILENLDVGRRCKYTWFNSL